MQLSQSPRPATYQSSTSATASLPGNSAANYSTANSNSSNNSTAALPSSNSSRIMAKLQRQNASSAAKQPRDSAEQQKQHLKWLIIGSPTTQLISPVSPPDSADSAAVAAAPILPPTLPPILPSTNWQQSAPKSVPNSAPKSPPTSPPTFSSPSPFAFASSSAAKPPNRLLHPSLSLPLPLLLFLLILVACGGSSQLPGADGLQLMLGKRRMCGIVLTQELRRVCTKQGTKGPCIHGHLGEHQRKRRSLESLAEEDSTTFWASSSASRNSRASRATSMFAAKWHQLFELREEQKQQRQLERQQMAQQIVGNGGGGRQRPSVAQLQTLLDQAIFKHIFLDHRGGSDGVFAAASSTSQPLTTVADDEFIGQRRKRMRIADKCCAQDGCDDKFLNSFCCDDDEQQAFQQINSM